MANSSNFSGVVFPKVKRVFATTIAAQLVPVQPLSSPRGFTPPPHPQYSTSYLLCEKQKEFLIWFYNSGHHIHDAFEMSKIIKNGRYTDEHREYLNSLLIMWEHEYIKSKNENKRNK